MFCGFNKRAHHVCIMDLALPESNTQVSGRKLCEACQAMEIESFFKVQSRAVVRKEGPSPDSEDEENYFRPLSDMLKEKERPFCYFGVKVLRLEYQSENLPALFGRMVPMKESPSFATLTVKSSYKTMGTLRK